MLVNIVLFAGVFLLPSLLAGTDRLLHPGPWTGFLSAFVTLATQPSLSVGALMHDDTDRRSALLIIVGAVLTQLLASLEFAQRAALFPRPDSLWVVSGVALAVSGLALRIWAIRTLGRFFTSSVQVQEGQRVLSTGPYAILRHPSYTGTLTTLVGIALSLGSFIGVALVLLVNLPIYWFRIATEERVLLAGLGDQYGRYRARTWRLVPFVFWTLEDGASRAQLHAGLCPRYRAPQSGARARNRRLRNCVKAELRQSVNPITSTSTSTKRRGLAGKAQRRTLRVRCRHRASDVARCGHA